MRNRTSLMLFLLLLPACSHDTQESNSAASVKNADETSLVLDSATSNIQWRDLKPGRHELALTYLGKDLFFAVHIPENYDPSVKAPLVVGLHYSFGDDTPPRRIANYFNLEVMIPGLGEIAENAIIASPVNLGGLWTDKQNEDAVVFFTKYMITSFNTDPEMTILAGFDIGGTGVWHIGGKHQDLFNYGLVVASTPSNVKRWANPILVIQSNDGTVVRPEPIKEAAGDLTSNGVDVELVWIDSGPYDVPKFVTAMRESASKWWTRP